MANIYNSLANIGARSQEILSPNSAETNNQEQYNDNNNHSFTMVILRILMVRVTDF
jgi:hypothetical protein